MTRIPTDKTGLIEWLALKGKNLGFHTETRYAAPENNALAEAAWFLNPEQKPIFTFTVEDDPNQLISSTLQWVNSSTEPKSWLHICIFLGGSTYSLGNLLTDNTKLYETETLHRLSADLVSLTKKMVKLFSNYSRFIAMNSKITVKRIAEIAANWPTGMQNKRLSLECRAQLGEGLNLFSVEDTEDEATEEPIFKTNRKVVPLERARAFSTEHRNYPFIFCLYIKENSESIVKLWFDVDKSNVIQALCFEALVEAIDESRTLSFVTPSCEFADLTLC